MPTNPPNPNQPITSPSGVSQDWESWAQTTRDVVDQSNKLNESLKNITQTLKDIAEARAFGNLESKLESYGKKLYEFNRIKEKQEELNKKIQAQQDKLNSTTEGAAFVKQIDEAVDRRRKLGEETNKIAALQAQLSQAETIGNQTAIDDLKNKIIAQTENVDLLRQQEEEYKKLITDNNALVQAVGEENAALAKQYILNKNLSEVYGDYIKNHQEEIDLIDKTLTGKEKELAYQRYILKTLQEENYLVKNTLNLKKEISSLLGFDKITLAAILQQAFTLDKIYNEHAKQLGISKNQVEEMADAYTGASSSAGSLNSFGSEFAMTNKNIVEASSELNKNLGTAAFLSEERLRDQVTLTKLMGLDVESATKLQYLSIVSGKSNKQVLDAVNNQVIGLGKQTGIYLDNRKVLEDVAKVSGQLAAQYKNNPELLAKAVVQAKELGLTLQQTAAMGDKLLDFPGSIESELKAELLTGKALNLEQARYYALMGDSAQAAKELMNNVGGIAEFQKLNVIQQRAIAEAIGMGKDELADSLKQQDLLKKTGDASIEALNERRRLAIETGKTEEFYAELRRLGTSDEIIANQTKLAQQDKMNMLVDKLMEGFSKIAQPVLYLVDLISGLVNLLGGVKNLVTIIGGFIVGKMVFGLVKSVGQMQMMNALLKAQNAQMTIQKAIAMATVPVEERLALAKIGQASAGSYGFATPLILGSIAAIAGAIGLSAMMGGFSGGGESFSETSKSNMGGSFDNKPIVVEVKNENNLIVNNRTAQEMNTQNTIVTSNKTDSR